MDKNIITLAIEKTKNGKLDWKESVYKTRYYSTIPGRSYRDKFDSLTFYISLEQKDGARLLSFLVVDPTGSVIWGKATKNALSLDSNEMELLFNMVTQRVYEKNNNSILLIIDALENL